MATKKFRVIIRPEFMEFCDDACRSGTLNHLLFRLAYKCKDQPKELIQAGQVLWYATTEEITEEMLNSWGVCKIRQEINKLIEMGLIGRTRDPNWGANRTKHFFFGQDQCGVFVHLCEEHHICIIHLDLPPEIMHLIYSSNANDKSIKCSCEKPEANDESIISKRSIHHLQTMNLSVANDESIEAITEVVRKVVPQVIQQSNITSSSGVEATTPPPQDKKVSLEPTDDEKELSLMAHVKLTPLLLEFFRSAKEYPTFILKDEVTEAAEYYEGQDITPTPTRFCNNLKKKLENHKKGLASESDSHSHKPAQQTSRYTKTPVPNHEYDATKYTEEQKAQDDQGLDTEYEFLMAKIAREKAGAA